MAQFNKAVILLILCAAIGSVESMFGASDIFSRAFGSTKVHALYPNHADLTQAIQRQHSKNLPTDESLHVGCSKTGHGGSPGSGITLAEAGVEISTLFISKRDDLHCYLIRCSSGDYAHLEGSHGVRFLGPVPSALKIDPSVLHALAVGTDSDIGQPLRISIKIRADSSISSPTLKLAEGGMNTNPPEAVTTWTSTVARMRAKDAAGLFRFAARDPPSSRFGTNGVNSSKFELSTDFVHIQSGPQKLNRRMIAPIFQLLNHFNLKTAVANADEFSRFQGRCSGTLKQLKFEYYRKYIEFRAPEVGGALDQSVCLLMFLFIVSEDNFVSAIGLRQTYSITNDVTRGIVQSGEPYHEPYSIAGLNGTGVVVGVADTGIDLHSCFVREDDKAIDAYPLPPTSPDIIDVSASELRRRKIVQYVSYVDSVDREGGHGSHVVGTIAGYCLNCTGTGAAGALPMDAYNGAAVGAKIAFFDIGDSAGQLTVPPDVNDLFTPSYTAGARIFSASWGGGFSYDEFTVSVDEYLYNHPDFLFIAAAGNYGGLGAQSTLAPGLAKNALTVGASKTPRASTDSKLHVAPFSSYGPTPDGRIKPEVVAPGFSTRSMKAGPAGGASRTCAEISMAGTSMATPAVSGAAALIRQYFEDGAFWSATCNRSYLRCRKGSFSPSGSLLKALLIHSTDGLVDETEQTTARNLNHRAPLVIDEHKVDISGFLSQHPSMAAFRQKVVPSSYTEFECVSNSCRSYKGGYGLVNLLNILPLPAAKFELYISEAELYNNQQHIYQLHCAGDMRLKITVTWFDPPNNDFAAILLLNDLDVVVMGPTGESIRGNHMFTEASGARRDEVNNVEQVFVSNPTPGLWSVAVQVNDLAGGCRQQNYSIVITGAREVEEPAQAVAFASRNASLLSCIGSSAGGHAVDEFEIVLYNYARSDVTTDAVIDYIVIYYVPLYETICYNTYDMKGCEAKLNVSDADEVARFSFDNSYFYDLKSYCVEGGFYLMKYIRNANGRAVDLNDFSLSSVPYAETETMASLPVCSTFLSPLVSTQVVRVAASSDSSTVEDIALVTCNSACNVRDHVSIQVALLNGFWFGSHYVIADVKSGAVISGGSLEVNFDKDVTLCLPAAPACYELKLLTSFNPEPGPISSDPQQYDDSPYMFFYESVSYNLSSKSEENSTCPYYLHAPVSSVFICTDGYSEAYFSYFNSSSSKAAAIAGDAMCYSPVRLSIESNSNSLRSLMNYSNISISSANVGSCVNGSVLEDAYTISLISDPESMLNLFLDSPDFSCRVLQRALPSESSAGWNSSLHYYENVHALHSSVGGNCFLANSTESDAFTIERSCLMYSYNRHVCISNSDGSVTHILDDTSNCVSNLSGIADEMFSPSVSPSAMPSTVRPSSVPTSMPSSQPTLVSTLVPSSDSGLDNIDDAASARSDYILSAVLLMGIVVTIVVFGYCYYCQPIRHLKRRLQFFRRGSNVEFVLPSGARSSSSPQNLDVVVVDSRGGTEDIEMAGTMKNSPLGKSRRMGSPENWKRKTLFLKTKKTNNYSKIGGVDDEEGN